MCNLLLKNSNVLKHGAGSLQIYSFITKNKKAHWVLMQARVKTKVSKSSNKVQMGQNPQTKMSERNPKALGKTEKIEGNRGELRRTGNT